MRFISLFVTFIAVGLSVFLGLTEYKDNDSAIRAENETEIYLKQSVTCRAQIEEITPRINDLNTQISDISAEITAIKKRTIYKTQPTAFLTFDDGTSYHTLDILDILNEKGVKGTFFVVGEQILNSGSSGKEAIKRIVEEGHTLAIHAYQHEYSKIYSSKEAYFEDFDKVVDLIYELTGTKPNIVRLPSGTYSAKLFCEKYGGDANIYYDIVSELYARGYTVIDWNVDTEDYTTSTGVSNIIKNAVNGAENRLSKEYKAAVILMHDTADTVSALPSIIDGVKELGMTFETIIQGGYVTRQIAETERP